MTAETMREENWPAAVEARRESNDQLPIAKLDSGMEVSVPSSSNRRSSSSTASESDFSQPPTLDSESDSENSSVSGNPHRAEEREEEEAVGAESSEGRGSKGQRPPEEEKEEDWQPDSGTTDSGSATPELSGSAVVPRSHSPTMLKLEPDPEEEEVKEEEEEEEARPTAVMKQNPADREDNGCGGGLHMNRRDSTLPPPTEVHNVSDNAQGKGSPITKASTPFLRRFFLLLDPRAVALFRIGLALCSLHEWYVAFMSRDAFLTDDGMLPRDIFLDIAQTHLYKRTAVNIWMAVGSAEAVFAVLIVQLLFTLSLLVGNHSRVCALVLSVFMNSWNIRLENKNGGGIEVLTVFLMWGAWMPLGDMYSLDALHWTGTSSGDDRGSSSGVVGWITELLVSFRDYFTSVAIPLHMAVMYYSCGVVKETKHWKSGDAVLMVVHQGMGSNQPFASIMGGLPAFCRLLTKATVLMETYGGFSLLVPSEAVRLAALAALIPFHLGMHLSLDIGMFQTTMMSVLVLLTPPSGCDVLEKGIHAVSRKIPSLCSWFGSHSIVSPPKSEKRSAKTVGGCLGAFFAAVMVVLMLYSITNDLCRHLGKVTNGKYTCWLGHGRPYNESFHRWLTLLGMAQSHTPYREINVDEDFYHIVGIVEDFDASSKDSNCDDGLGVCKVGEKTVAILTDKTRSQLNFDDKNLWSPDQKTHVNIRWKKHFENPDTLKIGAHEHLADHICRKWNRRPGKPKLKSVATVRTWKRMRPRDGVLHFDPHRYTIKAHHKCSDDGQVGYESNATIIANQVEKVLGVELMDVFVMNNVRYPLNVFWVNHKTGKLIPKGKVHARSHWTQSARIGHEFKFYWDTTGSQTEKELLAASIITGQTESNIVLEPTKDWMISLKNKSRYPLLAYWVHHTDGTELFKNRIEAHSSWWQTAELGHKFRFYWDVPNGEKMLAHEDRVEAEHKPITINYPKNIVIKNSAQYPLLFYWVQPISGTEMPKGGLLPNSTIDQETKTGHVFRLYYDLPDSMKSSYEGGRLLAKEFAVSLLVDEVNVRNRPEWGQTPSRV